MSRDRFEVLERIAPLIDAPQLSFEGFRRRRDRKRRNQRIAAVVVAIAVFAAPILIAATGWWSVSTRTPASSGPTETPSFPAVSTDVAEERLPRLRQLAQEAITTLEGVTVDQALVDSINSCERLPVTRHEVISALGFRVQAPAPWEAAYFNPGPGEGPLEHPATKIERWGGVVVGCEYGSLTRWNGTEGIDAFPEARQLVISAYAADAPPPLGRSRSVQGIGDEAKFSLYGNGDGHVDGPEGATSVLQMRIGDLILRFNGSTSPFA
jgi:hypothetical protein